MTRRRKRTPERSKDAPQSKMDSAPGRLLDRDGFMPTRSPDMTDEEYEAAREMVSRELVQQGWQTLRRIVEAGSYPAPEYMADLIREGLPQDMDLRTWALEYVAGRLDGTITQAGRPVARPANLHVPDKITLASTGGLPLNRAYAVWRFRRAHARYAAIKTTREPRTANRPGMMYVRSKGVWRVRDPKGRARARIASRYHIAEATLDTWDRAAMKDFGRAPSRG